MGTVYIIMNNEGWDERIMEQIYKSSYIWAYCHYIYTVESGRETHLETKDASFNVCRLS